MNRNAKLKHVAEGVETLLTILFSIIKIVRAKSFAKS
jgi:hypothetical protein